MGWLSLTELRGVSCIRSPDRLRSRPRMHRADSNVSHCLSDTNSDKIAEVRRIKLGNPAWRAERVHAFDAWPGLDR
jgi:hypothetical protein